jgi:purine-binding chemotaxis protein CheW
MNAGRYCTFFLEKFLLGVDSGRVQEVIQRREVTRVPLASGIVRGLINLRGQIVPAIDLRRRFGLPPVTTDETSINIVVRTALGDVSLLADRIGEVVEVNPTDHERAPNTLRAPASELVREIYKTEHGLVLVLNAEKAVTNPEDQ